MLGIMHALVERVVQLLQLLSQERVAFSLQDLLDLALGERSPAVDELGVLLAVVVALLAKFLGIDDQLLEGVEHLDPLLVDLGVYDVFEQNQLVKGHSEVVTR